MAIPCVDFVLQGIALVLDGTGRSKLNVDKLLLRQQQGFRCVSPSGHNAFGTQSERVLPASSVSNLYPFNYSGKLDGKGFYIGKDKYGSNIPGASTREMKIRPLQIF